MNRKQRVEMILRILLTPFLTAHADRDDLLYQKAVAYRKMVRSSGDVKTERNAYAAARERLTRRLEIQTAPDCPGELEQLLEMFYPDEALKDYLEENRLESLDGYYIQTLLQIAAEFITLRNGYISIRMWDETGKDRFFYGNTGLFKVELWSVLCRLITPDTLIAAYLVENGIDDLEQLADIPDNLFLSDTLLTKILNRGVAETHMHLSAGMSYLAVWQTVTDPAAQRIFPMGKRPVLQEAQRDEQSDNKILLIAGWLRLLLARYLEDEASNETDIYDYYREQQERQEQWKQEREHDTVERYILRHVLSDGLNHEHISRILEHMREEGVYFSHPLILGDPDAPPALDALLRGPYRKYRYLHTEPELILLFSCLRHIREFPAHRQFTRIFLNYIRIKNDYFHDKLQTVRAAGLSFFHRYFRSATSAFWRTSYEDNVKESLVYEAAFRNQLRCRSLRKLEVKISPRIATDWEKDLPFSNMSIEDDRRVIARGLYHIFTAYRRVCREQEKDAKVPELGIVYHFIKEDAFHPPDQWCWLAEDGGRQDSVSRLRRQCLRFLRALQSLLREIPCLPDYIVGLDAASQELIAEPWIYAPVYRQARSRRNTIPIHPRTGTHMQNIGLTYHVGEDYHHILTGIRHIDEVLTYFGYKAGDRLGHALALQVNTAEWIHDHETVPVPRIERLEDLIWLWSLCEDVEELGGYRHEFERKIMQLAKEIFQNLRGISPYILWEAYRRKFQELDEDFCADMKRSYLDMRCCGTDVPPGPQMDSLREFCCLAGGKDPVWDADKLLMTNYCPIYTRHFRKPMFVSNTFDELPVYQAIQCYIRGKLQRMGVYVETNPTSNIAIGDVGSLKDYPITSLNTPPSDGTDSASILLSVNSDDPLVFNTNVENELAVVYHILTYHGYGREESLHWIDKIRQYGMDSSFICGKKGRERQSEELKVICGYLRRIAGLSLPTDEE